MLITRNHLSKNATPPNTFAAHTKNSASSTTQQKNTDQHQLSSGLVCIEVGTLIKYRCRPLF